MLTLYDAARCPYCARARIALAEKGLGYETVEVDLDHRPAWMVELNPPGGRVPVIDEGGFVLPESVVIMEYLEERYPEPALLPADAADRASARLLIERFDRFGDPYYDIYFKRETGSVDRIESALGALDAQLEQFPYLGGTRVRRSPTSPTSRGFFALRRDSVSTSRASSPSAGGATACSSAPRSRPNGRS